jgi:Undecaprenyl-phosphate galactose phosphotransferase WbaP
MLSPHNTASNIETGPSMPVAAHKEQNERTYSREAYENVSRSSLKRLAARKDIGRVLRGFIATDALGFALAFLGAWGLAGFVNHTFMGRGIPNPLSSAEAPRLMIFAAIASGILLWFEHDGHYRMRMPFWLETRKIISVLSLAMLFDGFVQFAVKEDFSRVWLVSRWALAAVAIIALRYSLRAYLRHRNLWQVRSLLVGCGATADDVRSALRSEPTLGYEIVGQIDDVAQTLMVVGHSWSRLLSLHGADYIIVAMDGKDLAQADGAVDQLMREAVPFSISPPLRNLPVFGMESHYFFNHNVMLLARDNRLAHPLPRFIKRSFDVLASGTALILLSPLFLALALLVQTDGGPAFFRNRRLGAEGKIFDCLKFRSMVPNADRILDDYLARNPEVRAEWDSHKKLRGEDPRLTRIGRLLRRTSMDELPQLLNVLMGEMSLVGPRPILLRELNEYGHDIAHYYRLRPGITGMWQVNGRNDVSYQQRVGMDSWYVRNWSLWHDIVILCKTVPVLIHRKGAF